MLTFWFTGILLILIPYYANVRNNFEKRGLTSNTYGALAGLLFSLVIASVSLFLYGTDIKLGPETIAVTSFIVSFVLCNLCFAYFCRSWMGYGLSAVVSILVALSFVWHPNIYSNNITLALTTLGICSIIGHRMTKPCVCVVYALMCAFDVYAVWYSDIMQVIFQKYPDFTPAGLATMFVVPHNDFLGAGDVVFAEIGMVAIASLVDFKRAGIAGLLYVLGIVALNIIRYFGYAPTTFPYMAIISPITIALLYTRFRVYQTQTLIMNNDASY